MLKIPVMKGELKFMIVLIVSIKMKPGKREEYVKLAADCVKATRQEKGNISYDALLSPEDPDGFFFVEQWTDMEALGAHMKSEHFIKLSTASAGLADGPPNVKFYEATPKEFSL